MKLPFGGAQGAVFDILCPLSAMQWSRSEREKMKLPFGGAQGAVFDFLCPLNAGHVVEVPKHGREREKYEVTLCQCSGCRVCFSLPAERNVVEPK